MPIDESLIIKLQADVNQYKKEMQSAAGVTQQAQKNIETSVNKITQGIRQSSNGFQNFGRNAGQAGIQLQQFVGQVQGGQSVFLAMSQQAADLGIVLGAPLVGVIVALGAALAGTLLPNLMSSTTALEAMIQAADKLEPVLKKTESGAQALADELLELSNLSEALARVKIAKGISDAEKTIVSAGEGIKESLDDLPQTIKAFADELSVAFEQTGGDAKTFSDTLSDSLSVKGVPISTVSDLRQAVRELASTFNITQNQAAELGVALGNVKRDANPLSIQQLSLVLESLNEQTGFGNTRLVEFTDSLTPFISQTSLSINQINALRIAMADFSGEVENAKGGGSVGNYFGVTPEEFEANNLSFLEQSQSFGSFYLELKQNQADAEAEINRQKLEKISAQEKQAAQLREQQEKRAAMARQLIQLSSARSIISGLGALNSAFLEDNKAFNAGLIIADTAAAAIAAYKAGASTGIPGAGEAAAFKALAFGAAQLAANNSASKGGGSISGGAGGGATPTEQPTGQTTVEVSDVATNQTQVVRIELDGLDTFIEGVSKKIDEGKANGSL